MKDSNNVTTVATHYHPPGTAPGTLVEHDSKTAKPLTITMTVYTD